MLFYKKVKKRFNKIENRALRVASIVATMTAIVGLIPVIVSVLVWIYFFAVDIYNISDNVKSFRNAIEYSYFMDMQSQSIDHEEMDCDTVYEVVLQKTNSGDYYYFDTITINGNVRDIVYGAFVKKKANRDGLHVYITDMHGNVRWINPNKR